MRKLTTDELNRIDIEDFKQAIKHPIVLVLDNIRSLNNVGSAFRTSDAFFIDKLYLCGITGKPPHRDIQKTALGATESVTWKHFPNTLDAIQELKQEGYQVICVEQIDTSVSLEKFSFSSKEKYALIFGNEAFGVADEVVDASDIALEIPQFGTKHSLNISVSVGVVLWHYLTTAILKP